MERTRLSHNFIFEKIAIITALCVYLVVLITSFSLIGLVFIFVFAIIGYKPFYNHGDNIEFDDDYMYIIEKDGEIAVDLKNIFYVSPRTFWSTGNLGKIKYHYEGSDYFAEFSYRYFSRSLKKFTNAVLEKNPRAVIKGITPDPFDFN